MKKLWLQTIVTCLLLCACRTSGQVQSRMILPFGEDRHEVKKNEIFLAPATIGDLSLPSYPESLLKMHLDPQVVCVDFVVLDTGSVDQVRPRFGVEGCPSHDTPQLAGFVESALEAVKRWQFLAAAICRFPDGLTPNESCEGDGVTEIAVSVKLTYRFSFSQKSGRALVTGSEQ